MIYNCQLKFCKKRRINWCFLHLCVRIKIRLLKFKLCCNNRMLCLTLYVLLLALTLRNQYIVTTINPQSYLNNLVLHLNFYLSVLKVILAYLQEQLLCYSCSKIQLYVISYAAYCKTIAKYFHTNYLLKHHQSEVLMMYIILNYQMILKYLHVDYIKRPLLKLQL